MQSLVASLLFIYLVVIVMMGTRLALQSTLWMNGLKWEICKRVDMDREQSQMAIEHTLLVEMDFKRKLSPLWAFILICELQIV